MSQKGQQSKVVVICICRKVVNNQIKLEIKKGETEHTNQNIHYMGILYIVQDKFQKTW